MSQPRAYITCIRPSVLAGLQVKSTRSLQIEDARKISSLDEMKSPGNRFAQYTEKHIDKIVGYFKYYTTYVSYNPGTLY